ncbi:MAG: SGNH/GDSL hydrolase family protein [Pseudomonadota bacterium]
MPSRKDLGYLVVMVMICALALTASPAAAGRPVNLLDQADGIGGVSYAVDGGSVGWALDDTDGYQFICSSIGDSLTENSNPQGTFYSRLNDPGYIYRSIPGYTQVYKHGLPGGTTASILNLVESRDYGAGEGANFVVIMAGTNDIDYNRGDSKEALADALVANVQAIVDSVLGGISDPNLRPAVIVSGIPPYLDADLTAKAKYYNEQLRTRLDKVDIFSDANFWDLYDAGSGTADSGLMSDNKHPNSDGFYRVGENWFEAVDALYNEKRINSSNHIYKGAWYFDRG